MNISSYQESGMVVIDPVDDVVSDPLVTPGIHSVACTAGILISRPNADQCHGPVVLELSTIDRVCDESATLRACFVVTKPWVS